MERTSGPSKGGPDTYRSGTVQYSFELCTRSKINTVLLIIREVAELTEMARLKYIRKCGMERPGPLELSGFQL